MKKWGCNIVIYLFTWTLKHLFNMETCFILIYSLLINIYYTSAIHQYWYHFRPGIWICYYNRHIQNNVLISTCILKRMLHGWKKIYAFCLQNVKSSMVTERNYKLISTNKKIIWFNTNTFFKDFMKGKHDWKIAFL